MHRRPRGEQEDRGLGNAILLCLRMIVLHFLVLAKKKKKPAEQTNKWAAHLRGFGRRERPESGKHYTAQHLSSSSVVSFFLFFFIVNNKNFILIIAVVVFSMRMYGQRSIKCTFILDSEAWLRPENF